MESSVNMQLDSWRTLVHMRRGITIIAAAAPIVLAGCTPEEIEKVQRVVEQMADTSEREQSSSEDAAAAVDNRAGLSHSCVVGDAWATSQVSLQNGVDPSGWTISVDGEPFRPLVPGETLTPAQHTTVIRAPEGGQRTWSTPSCVNSTGG